MSNWTRRLFVRSRGTSTDLGGGSHAELRVEPNADHAWKALALVNDWIRHSDAKAGVTLAFVGALGAMLFNLTRNTQADCEIIFPVAAGSALLLVTAAVLCGLTLSPRSVDRDAVPDAVNLLFYASISRNFKRNRVGFSDVFGTLTADERELVRHIAHQIHANAKIATTKVSLARWAIRSAFLAGLGVASTALLTVL